jgi:hypothetical protein
MIYDELRFYHPLLHLVLFGHYNYTKYCSMKGSLLSLANHANFVYMVHGIFLYFPLKNLGSFPSDPCECPHNPIPNVEKSIQWVKWWWIANGNGTQCCLKNS